MQTDYLNNIEKLEFSLNAVNNLLESKVMYLGVVSLLLYFLGIGVFKFFTKFTKHDLKVGKHKIFDSVIKVTIIGSGSSVSGVMYATTLYLIKNPQAPQSFTKFFWITTLFTFTIILLAILCYWSLDKIKEKWGIELP